jgi:hypothetical protein
LLWFQSLVSKFNIVPLHDGIGGGGRGEYRPEPLRRKPPPYADDATRSTPGRLRHAAGLYKSNPVVDP